MAVFSYIVGFVMCWLFLREKMLERKTMKIHEAIIGTRVKTLVAISGLPTGTDGVIDEDYGSGVMVAWDLPDRPLPDGYCRFDGRPAVISSILRDGFDKETELHLLQRQQ